MPRAAPRAAAEEKARLEAEAKAQALQAEQEHLAREAEAAGAPVAEMPGGPEGDSE